MGIKVVVPAYKRQGKDALPKYRNKLQPWGEVQLGIDENDVELISIEVEDTDEGRSKNKIKASELLEALNIIMEQYDKRLEKATMTDAKIK